MTRTELRLKFLDDLSLAETISLKDVLEPSPSIIGPPNYHDRSGLSLPPERSRLQVRLNELKDFVDSAEMKVATSKTFIMPFNFTRKFSFTPHLTYDGEELDVIYSTKLLGVYLTSDGKWDKNIDHIVSKANQKLWFLKRLKYLGASRDTLLEIYNLFVRHIHYGPLV